MLLDDSRTEDYIGNMADFSLSLPTDLQDYVESRVAAEGYSNPADFVRQLVQRDRDSYRDDVRRVRALIQEGRDSGIVDAEPEDILDEIIGGIRAGHG